MSFKDQISKLSHFIAKNTVAAVAIGLILLTTVSVSAAQVIAPEQFKPSTFVNNIVQPKKADTQTNQSSMASSSGGMMS
jgi:cell division protein FtsW (lipid II flippase)